MEKSASGGIYLAVLKIGPEILVYIYICIAATHAL